MVVLLIYGFVTSTIGHLGNIGPLSYVGLANTDTFNYIISKTTFVNIITISGLPWWSSG